VNSRTATRTGRTVGALCLALTTALWIAGTNAGLAQGARSLGITVRETAGIRRTEYPISLRASLSKGAISSAEQLRLLSADAEIAGQFSPSGTWDDGSIQTVDVDFNSSIGAGETRKFRLEYGPDVKSGVAARGGLTVTDQDAGIKIGSVTLGRSGWPLWSSIAYRGEMIRSGANGVTIVDAAGGRHEFSAARDVTADIVKRGPLLVVVRYTGRVGLDGGADVPVTLTCELPNSKSWIKVSVSVQDAGRKVRGLVLDTPFALGAHPWTWDFGTDSGTYGVFRAPSDDVLLTQVVDGRGNSWRAETGSNGERRVYEQSLPGRLTTVGGWGHLLDGKNAIAFAIDRFARSKGTYTMALTGQGQATFSFMGAQPTTSHQLTVYQHYVGTPVPIGAATSPTAMLRSLEASVDR
jgi:hypothetical protein